VAATLDVVLSRASRAGIRMAHRPPSCE